MYYAPFMRGSEPPLTDLIIARPADADPTTFHDRAGEEDAFQVGKGPHGTWEEGTPSEGQISGRSVECQWSGTSKRTAWQGRGSGSYSA
jgi:hypothetical protein